MVYIIFAALFIRKSWTMSFTTTTIQPVSKPESQPLAEKTPSAAALLSMLVLSVYAAQKGSKSFRKMKRRFMWTALKLKAKSMFTKKRAVNDRTLIYILIGIVALVLVFYYPLLALLLAVIALILILTGTI